MDKEQSRAVLLGYDHGAGVMQLLRLNCRMCEGPLGLLGLPAKQARLLLYCNGVGQAGGSCITPSSSRRGAVAPAGGSGLSRPCPTQGSCKSPAARKGRPVVMDSVGGASPCSGTAGK